MRILGIDPALRTTGYGVIESTRARVRLIEAGIVAPRIGATLENRLRELHAGITDVIEQTQPESIVIEELYTSYRNPSTAVLMAHARGVLCLAAAQAGVAVHTLGHARVKRALVGSGSARKGQVNAMVMHLLGLRTAPKPDDVSDALALALAFLNIASRNGFAANGAG
jgi:crossover junction endodeoxyribonuclease RuvC